MKHRATNHRIAQAALVLFAALACTSCGLLEELIFCNSISPVAPDAESLDLSAFEEFVFEQHTALADRDRNAPLFATIRRRADGRYTFQTTVVRIGIPFTGDCSQTILTYACLARLDLPPRVLTDHEVDCVQRVFQHVRTKSYINQGTHSICAGLIRFFTLRWDDMEISDTFLCLQPQQEVITLTIEELDEITELLNALRRW